MLKFFKNSLILLLCFIAYIWIRKESIVEHWLSENLHTQVSVGRISPKISGMKIRYLCVHNPLASERFPYVIEVENIDVNFSLISMLLSKKMEISDLLIHGAKFTVLPYTHHTSKTNWFLLWKNFTSHSPHPSDFSPSKLDTAPILIKRCLFINTRLYTPKSSHQDSSCIAIPSLEFHGVLNKHVALPNLSTALVSLLYLAMEESLYHANIPGDIVNSLSEEAHSYFSSSCPLLKEHATHTAQKRKSVKEIAEFAKEMFFH